MRAAREARKEAVCVQTARVRRVSARARAVVTEAHSRPADSPLSPVQRGLSKMVREHLSHSCTTFFSFHRRLIAQYDTTFHCRLTQSWRLSARSGWRI